jgi:hypothetical protein
LDGIDTTTRTRVAWRVRAAAVQATNCTDAAGALPAELISTGRLDIALTTPSTPADPCAPPDDPRGKLPDGLLRVEVLDTGSETTARFAWSYEDGAAAVAATVAGAAVTLAPSPSVSFFQNDLVEVSTLATGVKFAAAPATPYTVNSDTQIVATSPPGSGTVDVTVSTPVGTSATSAADRFTYVQPGKVAAAAQPGQPTAQGITPPTVPMPVQDAKPAPDAT